jgi:hypothetical protein
MPKFKQFACGALLSLAALMAPCVSSAAAQSTTLGQPGNWATTALPSNVALDTHLAPNGAPLSTQVPLELAGQAAADTYVNQTAYTAPFEYVPENTPLQPVRVCREAGNCVPNWGPAMYDLWRAAMGEGNSATYNSTTGKPVVDQYVGGGLPITSSTVASPGTDKEAVICRGGGNSATPPWVAQNANGTPFTRPDGQEIEGSCWEVWGLQPDPTYNPKLPISTSNTAWMISYGARRTGFMTQTTGTAPSTTYPLDTLSGAYTRPNQPAWYGPQVGTPGDPNSTTFDTGWGVTADETPLLTDVVQEADCQAVLNGATTFGHAIGIQLQYTRSPVAPATPVTGSWWPGNGSDGNNSAVAPVEGMRVFFNSSMSLPAGLNPAAQIMFRTLKKYGAVIDDQTGGGPVIQYNANGSYASGGALMIRSEQDSTGTGPCKQLGIATSLQGIPWAQISGPIKMGSDTNPNPTS